MLACSGPPAAEDSGLDARSGDGTLELEFDVIGSLTDGELELLELQVGLDHIEWKSDLGGELVMNHGEAVDLLAGATVPATRLPPALYSEVELYFEPGPWGGALEGRMRDLEGVHEAMEEEGFEIDARCREGVLELHAGEVGSVTLEIDTAAFFEKMREREEVDGEAFREALESATFLRCRGV